jgi:hypothetical protein
MKEPMNITREQFERERRPRFGATNPQRMVMPFWDWMIRGDDQPPPDDGCVLGRLGLMLREGILKSGYGPYRVRDLFQVPLNREDGPIWTFDRMGQTHTELPDGRIISVAGEHEDSYDPDFNIYNDVVVFAPDGTFEIYGYPRETFPPTDFHTATTDGDRLVIVGSIGYPEDRVPSVTPVYALNLATYRIDRLETTGQMPGWIGHHEIEHDDMRRVITVRGGKVFVGREAGGRFRRNVEEYELDLRTLVWHQTTDRNWPQFAISPVDRNWFGHNDRLDFENFHPTGIPHEILPPAEWNSRLLAVQGVTVRFTVSGFAVEVLVEGKLTENITAELVEAARQHVEAAIGRECVVEPY